MKMTPVLLVKSIENSLPFWSERLGWQKTAEVPDGDVLGFVILVRDNAELMLQTVESARKDQGSLIIGAGGYRTSLFIEVDDWEDVKTRVKGYEITMPERDTFYGMREIGVFDPDGNIVVFAKKLA